MSPTPYVEPARTARAEPRQALRRAFVERLGREPRLFRAPGRVNLIGEHTDYNDGFVLPVAIYRETVVAAAERPDRMLVVSSQALADRTALDLDALPEIAPGGWRSYVWAVLRSLESRGTRLRGAELLIASDVPLGGGLSSSAALEVSLALALLTLAGEPIDPLELALACRDAESLLGVCSGIMDPYVAAHARAGHALLLDCRRMSSECVPYDTSQVALVVCDSGVRHALASSEYNRRREECREAVERLRPALPAVASLRDVSPADLEHHAALLPDRLFRRARHVVTENARTLEAASALRAGDLRQLGELMAASHASLRYDYEVSSPELDRLVTIAGRQPGVLGARMTGGGFGGCTVSLVERTYLEAFASAVSREYAAEGPSEMSIFEVRPGPGMGEVVVEDQES